MTHEPTKSQMAEPPSKYAELFRVAQNARRVDFAQADAYARNMMVGDPLADAAMRSLSRVDQGERQRLVEAGMNGDARTLWEAPVELRDFFRSLKQPAYFEFDSARAMAGTRAFYKYSDMFFVGLVMSSLLTGLTEGLARPFYETGRTAGNLRRVRQNTRHIIEVTLPGGLDRHGDGWKLTVRIRMIHAQMRRLLLDSGEWDVAAEGVPLNMAHMGLAATGFSSANLEAVRKLGVRLTEREIDGYMHIWRYVSWLLGVPRELQVSSLEEGERLRRVARQCEYQPGEKARAVAHGYINTVPDMLSITDPAKREKFLRDVYKVSRALIGDPLADALDYPEQSTRGVLGLVRAQRRMKVVLARLLPGATPFALENFAGMLQRSVYDDVGISYRMPDAVREVDSSRW